MMFAVSACSSDAEKGETELSGSSGSVYADGSLEQLQESLLEEVGDRVFFDYDMSTIRPDQRRTVNGLGAWLNANSNVQLMIEGHADERGTREYNLALGERRASVVLEYLVALGIDAGRLSTISYGEERPDQLGSSESSWAANRRAVFVLR
jgi:peptidoglycan-associated lipoprotein